MLEIQLAQTSEALSAVYRIRYQCLTLELGDESHAYHAAATYYDADDAYCKRVFIAYLDGHPVATARLLLRKEHAFESDDFYDYPMLAALFGMDVQTLFSQIGLIDRVCIIKEYRGHKIFAALYEAVIAEMRREHGRIILAAIHQDNTKSDVVFRHFGFVSLPELKQCQDWQGYLYYRVLDQ